MGESPWEGEGIHKRKGHLRREKQNEDRVTHVRGEGPHERARQGKRPQIGQGHFREEGNIVRA